MISKPMPAINSPKHEARRHFDEALDHQRCGRLEDAKAAYLLAIKADRSLVVAYNNLAFVCMRMGDYVAAGKHFQKVVKLQPYNVEALHNLGFLYEKQAMTGTARTFYTKALQIDPRHHETYINLGMIAEPVVFASHLSHSPIFHIPSFLPFDDSPML
jgi:protein O-mannosyl-transferase